MRLSRVDHLLTVTEVRGRSCREDLESAAPGVLGELAAGRRYPALAELQALFAQEGLGTPRATFTRLGFELEGLLERSFPRPEHVETIRAAYIASVEDDALGLGAHRVGDRVHAAYQIAILAATVA